MPTDIVITAIDITILFLYIKWQYIQINKESANIVKNGICISITAMIYDVIKANGNINSSKRVISLIFISFLYTYTLQLTVKKYLIIDWSILIPHFSNKNHDKNQQKVHTMYQYNISLAFSKIKKNKRWWYKWKVI